MWIKESLDQLGSNMEETGFSFCVKTAKKSMILFTQGSSSSFITQTVINTVNGKQYTERH